ncbi:MAG: formyltetrahydrofolate deformylase [Acidimicrobiia bacterium]
MHHYVMTLTCPDRPGIVHAVAGALLDAGGNIVENAQFGDELTQTFCMRTRFETELASVDDVRASLAPVAERFRGELAVRSEAVVPRVLIMVSRMDHCLHDLLYRWGTGDLPIEIPLVVSNHPDCGELVARHGIPYVHLPVTAATKHDQEARLVELIEQHAIDFVVLARYMQVLSAELCAGFPGRIINIHHSFLPGFKGAKPYHQAHDRGVKLIGATAHYVTDDLDEGPIIEQDVVRVTHAQSAAEYAVIGRDVERMVLARAVRYQAESRVLLIGRRTVVFASY